MKKHFPGHFPQSKIDIKKLWDSCVFVVDANILLNLYRYSDRTSSEFLHVLGLVKDRIWLPHRAAQEFFANRLNVIGQQEKAYDTTIRTIDALQKGLENARQHPFVSESTMKRVRQVFDKLKAELTSNQKVHTKRITDDSIQAFIAKVFAGRVGEAYDSEHLTKIFEEGETRYTERIPPGFRDEAKSDGSGTHSKCCRKYGDLLVWYQILDYAKEHNVSVILVTDDKKEDWWQIFNGRTIGPRPELLQEFLSKTQQSFHMYQADRFLVFATKQFNQTIAETTLSEIREVRQRDFLVHRVERHRREEMARRLEYNTLSDRIHALRQRRASSMKEREVFMFKQQILQDSLSDDFKDPNFNEQFMPLLPQIQEIEVRISDTQNELHSLEKARRQIRREMQMSSRSIEQVAQADRKS